MSGINIMTSIFVAFAILAVNSSSVAAAEVDAALRTELEHIARQRIFFGHQSVGMNLLDGIKQLSVMAGVPVHIVESPAAIDVPPATFGHMFVKRNGDPLLKLQSFEHAFEQQPAKIDVALVKFCYVDINTDSDTKTLFTQYRSTIERLRAKNPSTIFVHVTAPLTSEKNGLKAFLKRLLGRGSSGQNVYREKYNALLRKAYQGREPIFDLARIESTKPDGTTVTVEWNGTIAPALYSAYTNDGGHLNSTGRLRAARELISVLAAIPKR